MMHRGEKTTYFGAKGCPGERSHVLRVMHSPALNQTFQQLSEKSKAEVMERGECIVLYKWSLCALCSPRPLLADCGVFAASCSIPSLLLPPRARDVHPWLLAWKIPAPYRGESREDKAESVQCPALLPFPRDTAWIPSVSWVPLLETETSARNVSAAQIESGWRILPGVQSKYPRSRTSQSQQNSGAAACWSLGNISSSVTEDSVSWWLQRSRDFIRSVAGVPSKEFLRLPQLHKLYLQALSPLLICLLLP